jgi:8-oxo-dGTP pyrophosphatase MutT (NUDIX family)
MNYPILHNKKQFLEQVTKKLGTYPIDYAEKLQTIGEMENPSNHRLHAGVLLLLYFRENKSPEKENPPSPSFGKGGLGGFSNGTEGEFFFRLIRRSNRVAQAGDIACPGGMLHTKWDLPLKKLITGGLIPLLRNKAGLYARRRDSQTYNAVALFLANAVREAWEEIRLNPFRMLFLGPLPSHSLRLFQRTIFPLVGCVNSNHFFRLNDEVERIVDIPMQAFFQQENYGIITIIPGSGLLPSGKSSEAKPCLIYLDPEGRQNVLWGATFSIVTNFLKIVLDFQIPEVQTGLAVNKIIDANYVSSDNYSGAKAVLNGKMLK